MKILDNTQIIKRIDTEDMYHKIIHMPEQVSFAYSDAKIRKPQNFQFRDFSTIKRILICGMGGSAISADIAKVAFSNILPIDVVKDYYPSYVDKSTLIIALSYSGNTEETLSCFKSVSEKAEFFAAVTSGGELRNIVENKHLWVELDAGLPPRSAIAHLFFSLVRILEAFNIIPKAEEQVKRIIGNLVQKAGAIADSVEQDKNFAKLSAENIYGKIPIIYSTNPTLNPIAYRWKCQINENAKQPAFFNTFSEMNHNEIEGWEADNHNYKFIPIFINKFKDDSYYQKRVLAVKKLLDQKQVKYLDFFVEGETIIEECFSLIYLGDMISFYLAILYQTNPTSIDFINFLKKEITEKE